MGWSKIHIGTPINNLRWSNIATITAEFGLWSLEILRTPAFTETGTVQPRPTRTPTPGGKPLPLFGGWDSPPASLLVRPAPQALSSCESRPDGPVIAFKDRSRDMPTLRSCFRVLPPDHRDAAQRRPLEVPRHPTHCPRKTCPPAALTLTFLRTIFKGSTSQCLCLQVVQSIRSLWN